MSWDDALPGLWVFLSVINDMSAGAYCMLDQTIKEMSHTTIDIRTSLQNLAMSATLFTYTNYKHQL